MNVLDYPYLSQAIHVAKLIGHMMAPHLEVVFHDLTATGYPIVDILNGHVTGRKIGDKTSVFLSLEHKTDQVVNYDFPYEGKVYKSSSMILTDEKGRQCLGISFNFDTSKFDQFRLYIGSFFQSSTLENMSAGKVVGGSTDSLRNDIHRTLIGLNLGLQQLKSKEVKMILLELKKKDLLKKRGMISTLSKELGLTRKTIYSYISDIEKAIQ